MLCGLVGNPHIVRKKRLCGLGTILAEYQITFQVLELNHTRNLYLREKYICHLQSRLRLPQSRTKQHWTRAWSKEQRLYYIQHQSEDKAMKQWYISAWSIAESPDKEHCLLQTAFMGSFWNTILLLKEWRHLSLTVSSTVCKATSLRSTQITVSQLPFLYPGCSLKLFCPNTAPVQLYLLAISGKIIAQMVCYHRYGCKPNRTLCSPPNTLHCFSPKLHSSCVSAVTPGAEPQRAACTRLQEMTASEMSTRVMNSRLQEQPVH